MLVTPFVAFYLLRDWDVMVGRVDHLLPRDQAGEIRRLAREIDQKVAAFVRGQLLVGFLLGIFYAAGLVLIGLNYGLLIGLASGILSFIPYLGFTVGFVTSITIALVQYWPNWPWLAATVAVFLVGQLLEGYILQPRLIGRNVGLHPVWLIFALFAFGLLFGFVGLLVAIPARRRGWRAAPFRHRALQGKSAFPRERYCGHVMGERRPPAARQLPLSLAAPRRDDARRFSRRYRQCPGHRPGRPLAAMARAGRAARRSRRLGQDAHRRDWREGSGGEITSAADLTDAKVEPLVASGAVAVEDLHVGPIDEPALFHLLNLAGERKAPVLLTSRVWAAALPVRLADLASRLRAARPVELGEPDDDLLRRVLVKLFADRQLAVDAAVVDFVVVRMERSLQAASALADAIDHDALAANAPVTRRLAAAALARVFDRRPEDVDD